MRAKSWMTMVVAVGMIGCAGSDVGGPEPQESQGDPALEVLPPVEDDLAAARNQKDDTGYLSNLAAEVEGVFRSSVHVDVSHLELTEQHERMDALLADEWELRETADRQIKYAKGEINTDALHLNLSSSDAEVVDAVLRDGNIVITYEATIETLVTTEELDEEGRTVDDVIGTDYRATLPSDPTRMASDIGTACLEDGQEDAGEHNYFYYYDPARSGCRDAVEAAGMELVTGELSLHDLAPSKSVYPEYDRLTEDGRIDVVVFFGAADHDWEPGEWDWGTYQRDIFTRHLRGRGFVEDTAEHGDLYVRTAGELRERVNVIGPETLKLLRDDTDGLFADVVADNEIIMYNGHSFYGSLDVLDDPDVYPGRYQIFFMNSCWSYEYYTKQIFRNNATDEDPEGWALADVVNDTESGWFHNMAPTSRILLTNLLRGAETGGEDDGRTFDWEGIVEAMNRHGVEDQERRGTKSHEIYGVSGVRTNRYTPGGVVVDPDTGGGEQTFVSESPVQIPDNDPDGVVSTIDVEQGGTITSLRVNLSINHTYRGDLLVELRHGGRTVTLFDGARVDEPWTDNVVLDGEEFGDFDDLDVSGEWELLVSDSAAWDEGTLTQWSIVVETE